MLIGNEVLQRWRGGGFCDCNPTTVIEQLASELLETRRELELARKELADLKEQQ